MSIATLSIPVHAPVGQAGPEDAPALAAVLSAAFDDDPAGRWFFRRRDTRAHKLERFFRLVSLERLTLPHGEVLTTADRAGAALWMPPGSLDGGALQELRVLPRMLRACGRDLPRVMRGLSAMDALHPHEPHWYLPLLGVLPERQGEGIGSALLRPVLARCDADGLPAYLEATSERSRALYARHGFEVRGVMHLPDWGPPMWRMWREPR